VVELSFKGDRFKREEQCYKTRFWHDFYICTDAKR